MPSIGRNKWAVALAAVIGGCAGVAAKYAGGSTGITLSSGELGAIAGALTGTIVGQWLQNRDRSAER